ncbi:MAG: hypothetical protein N3A38_04875 [Planctomycetota bacterium]|nr:hypothetical protein [Planctomycetota bacterium]
MLRKYLEKRDVLWSEKTPRETLSRHGREFFEAERYSDALDFFERAMDEEGIRRIREVALKEGDAFLLGRIARLKPEWVSDGDWRTVEKAAEAAGKPSFAEQARKRYQPLTPELLQGKSSREERTPER